MSRRELIAKTRLYNNLLREARTEAGYETCMDLGRAVFPDGPPGRWLHVSQLESFIARPTRKGIDGEHEWKETAKDIAHFLNLDPEQLWPPEFQKASKVKPVFRLLSLDEAKQIAGWVDPLAIADENPGPEEQYEIKQLKQQVEQALNNLTPREERVLRMRFGIGEESDSSLEEVGQDFEVTRERIRQIEAKALRKLRHPSRSERLRQYHEDMPLPENHPPVIVKSSLMKRKKIIPWKQGCIGCKKLFTTKSITRKYCGYECMVNSRRAVQIEKCCPTCGKSFCTYILNPKRFCSEECIIRKPKQPPPEPRPCVVCGIPFTPNHDTGKLCGAKCISEFMRRRQRGIEAKQRLDEITRIMGGG